MKFRPKLLLVLILLTANISCDQVSKGIARDNISPGDKILVVENFLTLTLVENKGAFLSLGNTLPNWIRWILLIIIPSILLLIVLYYLLTQVRVPAMRLFGLSLIIGGGIGNIFDRIVYGSVTDFLHMDFYLFQTGIFNMADVSIMLGTFIILFQVFSERKLRQQQV